MQPCGEPDGPISGERHHLAGRLEPALRFAESVGPDLRLAELVDPAELGDLPLAYGTAAGDARLRAAIAEAHAVGPDDVVITVGGMPTGPG